MEPKPNRLPYWSERETRGSKTTHAPPPRPVRVTTKARQSRRKETTNSRSGPGTPPHGGETQPQRETDQENTNTPSSSARTTGNETQEQRTTGSEPDLTEEDNRFNRRKDTNTPSSSDRQRRKEPKQEDYESRR
ncbi:hypothetical protein F2Q69_00032483 [Brassica cretica]|uniref:Uncharacterized protein n=1 Tax=Brassica cretica TaxID=69181 RepID=A0A8S9S9Z2_BRACR|nr:hypothetical protein F2Q69_00032483 [Brassica cretica]